MSSYFFISIIFIVLLQLYNGVCDGYEIPINDQITVIKNDESIELHYRNRQARFFTMCKFHHIENNTEIVNDNFDVTSSMEPNIMKRYNLYQNTVYDGWYQEFSIRSCDLTIDSPSPSDNGDWICSVKEGDKEMNATINIQESIIGLNEEEYRIEKQTTIIKPGVDFTVRSIPIDKKYGYVRCLLVSPDGTTYEASEEDMKNGNCTVRIVNANKNHTGTWKWDLGSMLYGSTVLFQREIEEQFSIVVDDFKVMTTEASIPARKEDEKIASSEKNEEIIKEISGEKTTVAPNEKETIISNVTEKTTRAPEKITNDSFFETFYVKIILISAIIVLVISIGIYFKIWAIIKFKLFGSNSSNGHV